MNNPYDMATTVSNLELDNERLARENIYMNSHHVNTTQENQ